MESTYLLKIKNPSKGIALIEKELEFSLLSLARNMSTYRDLTDELQKPTSRRFWTERFKLRSEKVYALKLHNDKLMSRILELCMSHYQSDIEDYDDNLRFADLEALSATNVTLFYFKLLSSVVNDMQAVIKELPFHVEYICQRYMPDLLARMPHSEITLLFWANLTEAQFQMTMLGDKEAPSKMVHAARQVLTFENRYDTFSSDVVRIRFLQAFRYLLYVGNICAGNISADDAIEVWKQYKVFRANHSYNLGITDSSLLDELKWVRSFADTFIPVYAIDYHRHHDDIKHKEWLYKELRNFVDTYPVAQPENCSFNLYAYSKSLLGDWSPNQSYQVTRDYYTALEWTPWLGKAIPQLSQAVYIINTLLSMLSETDLPLEVKQVRAALAIEWTLDEFKTCTSKYFNYELTHYIIKVISNPAINELLDSKQRRHFLRALFRNSLILIYAHSRMVSRISECILDAVMHYQPELLIGTMGIKNVESVPKHTRQLSEYLSRAAMIHDLGKISIVQIVCNDYITSLPHEEALLANHIQQGLELLNIDPSLKRYHDVILYHHKWYDGSQGLPKGTRSLHSPYRFFTDIISIAGYLEEGTDNMGRPLKQHRHFSEIFNEMTAQAGTRFNPDILQLISKHSAVYGNLSKLFHQGWEYNYYEVYLDFFGKR